MRHILAGRRGEFAPLFLQGGNCVGEGVCVSCNVKFYSLQKYHPFTPYYVRLLAIVRSFCYNKEKGNKRGFEL